MTFCLHATKNEFLLKDGTVVSSTEKHAVLRLKIASRLTLFSHLKQLCNKVANKLNVSTIIAPYLNQKQRPLIYSFFSTGQSSHCSFKSPHKLTPRTSSQNNILELIYQNNNSSFTKLLDLSNESTIHIKNIKCSYK